VTPFQWGSEGGTMALREVEDTPELGRKAAQAGRPVGPVQGFWVGRGRRE
jgi:hypothetical protein